MRLFYGALISLTLSGVAQANETMQPTSTDLIGGTVADPSDWPASPWVGNCSSTLIGEKVLLVAAHCTGNGSTKSFTIGSTRYSARCEHHASYRSNKTADWALCLIDSKVEGVPFESLASGDDVACTSGTEFLLTGYGCTRWGSSRDGKFRTGTASSIRCPSGTNYDTVTKGDVALCSGDSGGGAFLVLEDGSRRVVGVNSRSNKTDTSYVSSTYSKQFMDWASSWSEQKSVKICGLHPDATGCATTPDNPAPDCAQELDALNSAKASVVDAQKTYDECRSN